MRSSPVFVFAHSSLRPLLYILMSLVLGQCTAYLADGETQCTALARSSENFCPGHIKELRGSYKKYKDTAHRVEQLRPHAVTNREALRSLRTSVDIRRAMELTKEYLDALKEEAQRRTAHTQRFYSDGA